MEKEYLVKFRYINTGNEGHEVVRILPDEDINKVLLERWKGLLCGSGGLRDVLSVKPLNPTKIEYPEGCCSRCGAKEEPGNPCICYAR